MSDVVKRSGSDKRQKTVLKTLRFTPEEAETLERRAKDAGMSFSAYLRSTALNRKVVSRTDNTVLTELLRLGRLQKHLFVEGKRTGDKEYSEVLVAITELTSTLRLKLMQDD